MDSHSSYSADQRVEQYPKLFKGYLPNTKLSVDTQTGLRYTGLTHETERLVFYSRGYISCLVTYRDRKATVIAG